MSRPTPLRRYIARPASVVIRTVGGDAVAWNRATNTKTLLSPAYAALLASIPTRWTAADDISEPVTGALQQLLDAGLLVSRPAGDR